jgi:outer membrane protein OmpA-like peptidoglycan-associated protein
MRPLATAIVAIATFAAIPAFAEPDPRYVAAANKDAPKSADHALTGRYEGAHILGQTVKAFDELTLVSGPAEGKPWDSKKKFSASVAAEGKVTRTLYASPVGRSSLEVFKNHRDALVAKGYAPVFECAKEACGESFYALKYRWDNKEAQPLAPGYEQIRNLLIQAAFDAVIDVRYALLKKGNSYAAIYVAVNRGGSMGSYSEVLNDRATALIEMVDAAGMEQKIVTIKAEEISSDIAKEGRAVFYGIHFDFDKADIKPESEPQLAEMAKALKADPKLKVFVIGHSDNQGKLDYNTGLSERRAQAVVKVLSTKYGIEAKRMTARGLASLSPVTTNRTEEGRAKNRRVEMVEQ